MPDFKEYFIQYIWRHQLFDRQNLATTNGKSVLVLKTGRHNTDAGPDFLFSEIVIDGLKWAGSVEIHVKSSGWLRHKHHTDKTYENVILHVVWEDDDKELTIPCLELKGRIDKKYINGFERLIKSTSEIPCEPFFRDIPSIYKTEMLEKAFLSRITKKTKAIEVLLIHYGGDWEQTSYHLLLTSFGFKVNSEAFGSLAEALPLKILQKHRNSLIQIESLLFGMAGLLEKDFDDLYFNALKKEFMFLKHKYNLEPIHMPLKFLRLRPSNFPTIRLAQIAQVIYLKDHFFSVFKSDFNYKSINSFFDVCQSEYWQTHYMFGRKVDSCIPSLGVESINGLITNAIIPLRILYANHAHELESHLASSIGVLHLIKPEKNHKTALWERLGLKPTHVYDSQAMIEWYDGYCFLKRCLDCSIGNQILKR